MGKKKQQKGTRSKSKSIIIPFLIIIAVVTIYVVLNKKEKKVSKPLKVGAADHCRKEPGFIKKNNIRAPWAIDLTQHKFTGLRIIEYREGGKKIQLPGWDLGGHLVSYAIDRRGHIFLIPSPYVSLTKNPPEEQNKVFIVFSNTGKMQEYIDLPPPLPLTSENPFGTMGITYDCETECIYTSSLAGSSFDEEVGIIYQIDLKTNKVIDQLNGVDALGLAVFNANSGKRLYYGSARHSEIYSVKLSDEGKFEGEPRFEFSLVAQKGGSLDKAVRIRFMKDNSLQIKAMEFSYSLIASSDPLRNIYTFDYQQNDQWSFREMHKQ